MVRAGRQQCHSHEAKLKSRMREDGRSNERVQEQAYIQFLIIALLTSHLEHRGMWFAVAFVLLISKCVELASVVVGCVKVIGRELMSDGEFCGLKFYAILPYCMYLIFLK